MLAERVREWTREWWDGGLQEGVQQGEAAILTELLEVKFGRVDEEHRGRIAAADAETLLRWARRVLAAQRAEDVFA